MTLDAVAWIPVLLAPTLMWSQTLSALHEAVHAATIEPLATA
jgi:hypothetical protein